VKDLNTVENAEQAGLGAAMAFPGGSMFGGGRTLANHYRAPRGPLEKASQAAPEFNAPTIDDHFATAAEANRLPLDYLKAVAQVESNGKQFDANGKPTNPGTSNALGVMQVIPKWHPEFDKEKLANDAEYNIHAGAQILGKLFDETDPNLPASERLRIASKRYFGHKDAAKNEEYANKVDAAMGQPMASASQQSGIVQPGAWADDQSPMPERTPQLPENPAAQDEAELERQAIQNEDSAPSDQFDNSIPFEQKTRDQIADEWEFADSLNEPKPTEQRSEADQEARKRLLFNRIDPSALSATDGGSLAERVNADAMPDGSVATPNKPVEVNHETLPKQQSNALQSQSQQAPGSSNANVAQPVVSANELNTVDQAAHEAALSPTNDRPEPTQAMKSAGNYKKGHISVGGLNISIENPQGSVRRGVDKNGAAWENLLHDHYGYIKGTVGNDKDHIDTFVKAGTPDDYSGDVFVVDQKNPETGRFDEHKVMIGYGDQKEAEAAYRRNYAKDWDGIKSISPVSMGQFKDWLSNGDTTKPMAKHIEAGKRANEILNQTEMQYIKAQVKAEKLNPKSPGYMQRLKAIKSAYPVELDKALARSSFETYAAHPSNKGVPENLLRQGYEALQQEHGVAENGGVKFSKSPMKSVEANVKRGREAMNKALLDKTTAHRAMFRTGMGWVDFVWGDEGATPTMEGKRKGAKGISHIIEARQRKDGLSAQQAENILFDLVDTIASGEEFKRTEIDKSTRVGLRNNGNIVWLTKHRGSNSWMVTGYKENPDGRMAGRATHAPTQPEASLTRNGLGAGEKNIAQSSKNTIAQNTDDAKPSKSNKKTGSTVEQVRSWLPPRVKPLLDSGKLEVVQSADDLPEHITEAHSKSPGVEGLYDYDKGLGRDQIYLVADMLTKEN
ncbi:MAG: putative barnase/colicin E5 family endoribonuclease, partial [Methylobacter sp.]